MASICFCAVVSSPAHIAGMTQILAQPRTPSGIPSGGRFAVRTVRESPVTLTQPTPAQLASRRASRLAQFQLDNAGTPCPNSGQTVQLQWHRGEKVTRTVSGHRGFVSAVYPCWRCGTPAVPVEARRQAGIAYNWKFSTHTVPAGE
jgi:hypothetical protein